MNVLFVRRFALLRLLFRWIALICSRSWRAVGGWFPAFWRGDLLPVIHSKEHVVAEAVATMNALSLPVVIDVRAPRQPHADIAFGEFYGPIFNVSPVRSQPDFFNRSNQVCFQPDDLEGVRRNPHTPLQCDRIGRAVHPNAVSLDHVWFVRPLFEMDLPGKSCAQARQSFATHRKVWCIEGVKDQHESRQT